MIGSYDCPSLRKLLEQGGKLVDVRSHFEYTQGALQGALNMPLEQFQYHADKIDKDKPVLLYCRSGQRSEMAKRYLQSLGFANVHNIGSYQQLVHCVG